MVAYMTQIKDSYIKENGKYLVDNKDTPQCAKITLGTYIEATTAGTYKVEIKLRNVGTMNEASFYSQPKALAAGVRTAMETESFLLRKHEDMEMVWVVLYNAQGTQIEAGSPVGLQSNLTIRSSQDPIPAKCPESGNTILYLAGVVIVLGGLYYLKKRKR